MIKKKRKKRLLVIALFLLVVGGNIQQCTFFLECFWVFVQLSEYTSNRFILNSLRQDPLFSHLFILRGYKEIWFVVLIIREEVFSSPKKTPCEEEYRGEGGHWSKTLWKKWGGGSGTGSAKRIFCCFLYSAGGVNRKQWCLDLIPDPLHR